MLYIKLRVSDLAAGDNLSVFLSQCDRILNIYREHSKSLIPPPLYTSKAKEQSTQPGRLLFSFSILRCYHFTPLRIHFQ